MAEKAATRHRIGAFLLAILSAVATRTVADALDGSAQDAVATQHGAVAGAGVAGVARPRADDAARSRVDGLPAFAHALPLEETAAGHYLVHGVIDGDVETDFLVDTGSGYVALSKATFERVRREPGTRYLRDVIGATADGKRLSVPIYLVAEIAIGSCRLANVEVAVFRSTDRDILGLSALRRVEPFALGLAPPRLWLSACDGAPPP